MYQSYRPLCVCALSRKKKKEWDKNLNNQSKWKMEQNTQKAEIIGGTGHLKNAWIYKNNFSQKLRSPCKFCIQNHLKQINNLFWKISSQTIGNITWFWFDFLCPLIYLRKRSIFWSREVIWLFQASIWCSKVSQACARCDKPAKFVSIVVTLLSSELSLDSIEATKFPVKSLSWSEK